MNAEQSHICPSCGYEYERWVEVCPDCNVPIETRPPEFKVERPLEPDEDPGWTVATNVPNAILGNLLKSQLQDAGIPVLMTRSPSADIGQFTGNDYVPHDLRVPGHLLEQARQLIYSPPAYEDMAQPWGLGADEYAQNYRTEQEEEMEAGNSVPDGWLILSPRGEIPGSHGAGEGAPDWHWTDKPQQEFPGQQSYAGYSSERTSDDPYQPPSWIKVVYGILLLAISLPFIFQILGNIFSIFGTR